MIIRLCYVSQRDQNRENLLEELQDILITARNFNAQHDICGVLYYAEHRFFQCLEGEKSIIETLFASIQFDERHYQVIHLQTENIEQRHFKEWSMKYVRRNSILKAFLKEQKDQPSSPDQLDSESLTKCLNALIKATQNKVQPKKKIGFKYRGVNPLI